MDSMTPAIIFLGPTLPAKMAQETLDCIVLPPARQGDVYRAVRDRAPVAIGLIDGAFLGVRSVWHREILWALSRDVAVFGAASMGALRAAELDAFGMRGIGRVYEAYRLGCWPEFDPPFEDDDEVAVIHAPIELGAGALSDAMVDIRDTLIAAEQAGILEHWARDRLATAMKRLHFPQRSFARLAAECTRLLDPETTARMSDFLKSGRVACKRLDALHMLQAVANFLAEGAPQSRPDFVFERALVWEQFVNASKAKEDDQLDDVAASVLDELRLDPAGWLSALRAATGRLSASAGHQTNIAAQLDRFRHERRLWQRADLDAWLNENALDESGLARLLRQEAAWEATPSPPGVAAAMIDHLRLTGQFAVLLKRARAKHAALGSLRHHGAGSHEIQIAMDWYMQERIGAIGPGASAELLRRQGWPDRDRFEAAVWAEYAFASAGTMP
jgi:hypothetical protein